jgi:hypothetical protein
MSGYDLDEVASRAETLRVSDMIQKPFSRDDLCIVLKNSIRPEPTPGPSDAGTVDLRIARLDDFEIRDFRRPAQR